MVKRLRNLKGRSLIAYAYEQHTKLTRLNGEQLTILTNIASQEHTLKVKSFYLYVFAHLRDDNFEFTRPVAVNMKINFVFTTT